MLDSIDIFNWLLNFSRNPLLTLTKSLFENKTIWRTEKILYVGLGHFPSCPHGPFRIARKVFLSTLAFPEEIHNNI
jgi:hypothetical protein